MWMNEAQNLEMFGLMDVDSYIGKSIECSHEKFNIEWKLLFTSRGIPNKLYSYTPMEIFNHCQLSNQTSPEIR